MGSKYITWTDISPAGITSGTEWIYPIACSDIIYPLTSIVYPTYNISYPEQTLPNLFLCLFNAVGTYPIVTPPFLILPTYPSYLPCSRFVQRGGHLRRIHGGGGRRRRVGLVRPGIRHPSPALHHLLGRIVLGTMHPYIQITSIYTLHSERHTYTYIPSRRRISHIFSSVTPFLSFIHPAGRRCQSQQVPPLLRVLRRAPRGLRRGQASHPHEDDRRRGVLDLAVPRPEDPQRREHHGSHHVNTSQSRRQQPSQSL